MSENDAKIIEGAFKRHLTNKTVSVLVRWSKGTVLAVTATVTGPIQGTEMTSIVNEVSQFEVFEFSIYRSGTGLTIKFQ